MSDQLRERDSRGVPAEAISWVRDQLQLTEFTPEMWQDCHDEVAAGFLSARKEKDLPPIMIAW